MISIAKAFWDEYMSELENRTVIGIDRGASFTDFGVVKSGLRNGIRGCDQIRI